MTRVAAGVEIIAILFNMFLAFMWFLTLIWVLIGVLWGFAGLVLFCQLGFAVFLLVKGYTPISIASPILGLILSVFNFNFFAGSIELVVLMLMIGSMIVRGQEDAALAR